MFLDSVLRSYPHKNNEVLTRNDIDSDLRQKFNLTNIGNLGVEIIEKPKLRPWGTRNMSFYDPDGNVIYLRSFNKYQINQPIIFNSEVMKSTGFQGQIWEGNRLI